MENEPPVVRRRRKISRSMREKTPEPNFAPTMRRKLSDYDDENSYVEGTTASEDTTQVVSMQIRPPGAISAHQSKILRRRDKTFANTAARSLSQPRQAERISSPVAQDLIQTAAKRSLSSPRHKDESSENELIHTTTLKDQQQEALRPTVRSRTNATATITTAADLCFPGVNDPGPIATADENLSRLELNLRRFEEERKRLEFEKRLFEREKREHRARHKQLLDNEERKRLLQNYRKLSDHIQLPTDAEERRRMVHSLRLNRNDAPAQVRPKNRNHVYDESSTQFSSSEAEADETRMAKQFSPTRRHAPTAVANKLNNSSSIRGPPPQPPERQSVSRNNSLSPIRPQRRSKTPEQRVTATQNLSINEQATEKKAEEKQKTTPERSSNGKPPTEVSEKNVVRKRSNRKDSLPDANLERQQSLEGAADKVQRRKRSLEKAATPKVKAVAVAEPIVAPIEQRWFEKLFKFLKKKKPPLETTESVALVQEDQDLVAQKEEDAKEMSLLSAGFLRQFRKDAREQWQFLMFKYPEELVEFRRLRNKCYGHTIMLILLCGFGGLMFRYTEGASENIYKCEVRKVKRDFIDNLWTVSHNMREDDWKSLARQKLRNFEEELTALQELGIRRIPGAKSWNFVNCIIYCWTVVTTIGYGHITPKTSLGQFLTIVYAIIGIPLFLILLTDFGKLFTRGLKILWAFVRRLYYTGTCRQIRKQQQVRDAISGFNTVYDMAVRRPSHFFSIESEGDVESQNNATPVAAGGSHLETPTSPYPETFEINDDFNLPISVATSILIAYILIGAAVYPIWEKQWDYFDAIYFIFISMSTIGFGDLVPQHPIFMMLSIIYLVFGLALTSMFINVVQIKLSDTFKHASAKIGATIGLASEAGDETGSEPKTPSEIASIHGAARLGKIAEDENEKAIGPQLQSILRPSNAPLNDDNKAT